MSLRRMLIDLGPTMPSYVPRLVPTAGWPSVDYSMLIEMDVTSADHSSYAYVFNGGPVRAQHVATISNRVVFDFPGRNFLESFGPGVIQILINQNAAGYAQVYQNGFLVAQGTSGGANWQPNCGVGVHYDGVTLPTTNQATKFKVLSGVYTNFATADAVTGANLIFNGLVP